jgi:hypothetical protein
VLSLQVTNASRALPHQVALGEIPPGMELLGDTGVIGRVDTANTPSGGHPPGVLAHDGTHVAILDLKGGPLLFLSKL